MMILVFIYYGADHNSCKEVYASEHSPAVSLSNWTVVQLALDLVGLIKEITLILTFKYAENPKRNEIFISLFNICLIWNLACFWAIYGCTFYFSDIWGDCFENEQAAGVLSKIFIAMLILDFGILFFNLLLFPLILRAVCLVCYQRIYVSCIEKTRSKVKKSIY